MKINYFLISILAGILLLVLLFILFYSGCSSNPNNSPTSETYDNRFNVPALTNWNKETGIRVAGAPSPGVLLLNDGSYRIFYPKDSGIRSSISSDGLTFTAEAGYRIEAGSAESYDGLSAKDPDIVAESGYWRMYYCGEDRNNIFRVLSAVSTDGFIFTKEAGVRLDYSASYKQLASVPCVVKAGAANYKMYYVYDFYGDNSIKGATSTDGLNWTVQTLSGFSKNCMDPEAVFSNGSYIMFFAANRQEGLPEKQSTRISTRSGFNNYLDIYKAVSSDGINWTVVGQALKPDKIEEGNLVGDPDVIQLQNGTYRIYYYGVPTPETFYILSATAESL